jgi:hypothetical protein
MGKKTLERIYTKVLTLPLIDRNTGKKPAQKFDRSGC